MPVEGTTDVKTQLLVNDMVIPLNDFAQLYIGNILRGIATSFGCFGTKISMNIDRETLNLCSEDSDVQIRQEFIRAIVESTVKGMLSHLRGIVWFDNVTITTRV